VGFLLRLDAFPATASAFAETSAETSQPTNSVFLQSKFASKFPFVLDGNYAPA
jgi:hypothetical protein